MRRRFFRVFVFILAFLFLRCETALALDKTFLSNYAQTLFNADSGMGANEANDVLQTRDGYIWVATYSGLLRYDGARFHRYGSGGDGFSAKSATVLHEDGRGRLWVGTNDEGLFLHENGKFRRIPDTTDGFFSTVRSIAEDSAGNIYFGSSGGIGRVTEEGMERIPLGDYDTSFVQSMACDDMDRIWGVTRTGELIIASKEGLERLMTEKDMGGHSARCVARVNGGIFLSISDGAILAFSGKGRELSFERRDTPGITDINEIYEDKAGRVWVCGDNGVGCFDEELSSFTKIGGSLVDSSVEEMIQDYEGNYWFTSSRQGLLLLTRNKFVDVNFAAGIPRGVVNAAVVSDKKLYVGTDGGLYISDLANDFKPVRNELTKALEGKRVRCVMKDSSERLWISTYADSGLICYERGGKISSYTMNEGMPENQTRLTFELTDGSIVAGTIQGAAIIRGGAVVDVIDDDDGLTNLTVLSMCQDNAGVLYIGTDGGGIFALKDGKLTNYTRRDGLKSGVILRMMYDAANDGIWISAGNGLSFMDSGRKIREIEVDAPITSGIFDIKYWLDGRLMLLADTGVHIADPDRLLRGEKVEWVSYTRRDGLNSTVTANSWSNYDKAGDFFLCGTRGLYIINDMSVRKNMNKPKLAVNRAIVDGTVYENPTKLALPRRAKRLTLELSVLSFTNRAYNSGEYFLKGFDKEVNRVAANMLGNVSYTNLKGGNYTLIFNAENSDGIKSESPIVLPIEKERALYEEPAVIALLLAAAAALIFLSTRWYYRRRSLELERRQEELRAITGQALSAIADTIDAKDPYTRGHSSRVAEYSTAIAKKLGFTGQKLDNLYYTALLHDIGKIGVPDSILNKPGRLTDDEYEIMKQHAERGGYILRNITIIDEIKDGAAYHHERYDGKGYNCRLKGEEIPLIARIIAVADSVDAMASTRPYRTRRTDEYVISELEKNSGSQFDPKIAQVMIELIKSGELELFHEGNKGGEGD
ncbi:MAG: two-component regulator propeller domain-containing protein [Synergistaceae bacterium]|nr:two-component regulator propeller domain-containing protein [Synergistaceae bacterium]